MFKWLLKREHRVLAFEVGECGQMLFGHSDENTDANILDEFMSNLPELDSWCDLEYISISAYWTLFNRFEFGYREIFCHDLNPDSD